MSWYVIFYDKKITKMEYIDSWIEVLSTIPWWQKNNKIINKICITASAKKQNICYITIILVALKKKTEKTKKIVSKVTIKIWN